MLEDLASADDITEQVTRLLRAAGVDGHLPTPVDEIVAAAKLDRTDEVIVSDSMIKRAPKKMRGLLRSAARKIVGLLDRRERVIQIDPKFSRERRRFVTCHEVAHDIFPWQADLDVLGDDNRTLSPAAVEEFEREANQGAAEILFQQGLFAAIARDYPVEISTVPTLASMFGASFHATFRRWVESMDATACGLALDVDAANGRRRRYEQLLTPQWKARFGNSAYPGAVNERLFPGSYLKVLGGTTERVDLAGTRLELRYETFQTPYRRFVLVWLPTRDKFVARHRRRPTLVAGHG